MGMMLGLYDGPPSASGVLLLDATPYLTALGCSTDERGFEGLTGTIDRTLGEIMRFYNQAGVLYTGLAKNGSIVWEGRLEDPTLTANDQGSGLGIQALGFWRALTDDRYNALWSTTSVAAFVQGTSDMGVPAYAQAERWQRDTNGRLFIALVKGNAYGLNQRASLLMSIPHRSTRNIVGIQFSLEMNLPTQFDFRAISHPNDISSASIGAVTVEATLAGTAALVTRAYHLILTAPQATVGIEMLCNTAVAYAAETAASYIKVTNLRIVSSSTNRVATALTANRNAGTNVTATVGSTSGMYVGMQLVMASGNNPSEIVTVLSIGSSTQFNATFVGNYLNTHTVRGFRVLADEIVGDIVTQISTLNSGQLSSSTALIQSPGLDLTDEVYEDVVPDSICAHLATLGDNASPPNRWEVGVYEGRTLFFRPQGDAARTWYVDAVDLNMQRTIDDLANVTYATYQDVNNRRQATIDASDSASIARYGISRRANVSADTTSTIQAGVIRDAELQDQKDPKPRATVRFEAIYDAYGARYPLWLVRAGDTITVRNIPPSLSSSIDRVRTFRVTHTNYNVLADTLDVEPEAPPPTLEVMLAQKAEGIRR